MSPIKKISKKAFFCLLAASAVLTAKAGRERVPQLLQNTGVSPFAYIREKGSYIVEGTLRNMNITPEKVYMIFHGTSPRPDDSALVTNGKFIFKGHVDEPCMVTISKEYYDAQGKKIGMGRAGQSITFFLEDSPIKLDWPGEMTRPVVTGSKADIDYHKASYRMDKWGDTLRAAYKMAMETRNVTMLNTFLSPEKLKKAETLTKEDYPAFIRSNPASSINLYLIRQLMAIQASAGWTEKVDSLYQLLPVSTRSSEEGRKTGEQLAADRLVAIGHKAMDFTQEDVTGQAVSLSSFKGKYVLLCFWASNDEKAAAALPLMRSAAETYDGKGLVVLGVSLDDNKESWLTAVKNADPGKTRQVFGGKGKQNAAALLYGVGTLPDMLLIDPDGTIIASRLNSSNLDKTLSSVFE